MRNEEIDTSNQQPKKASSSQSRDKTETQRQKYEKIFRRIGRFKKYNHDLCALISNHSVKVAGLRDKNDELAKCLDDFTKIEEFSTTSKLSMAVAAELVATVGDHQDLAVQRTETLVLPNLSSYARICDCIKADLWNAIQAIKREKRKRKVVASLKKRGSDPKNKSLLNDAQRELERASAETTRFCQLCEEQVVKFEHKRLMDLKESLGNWIKIQIATHAKSLELWSDTYKHVQNIDEDGDLDILKTCLKIGSTGSGDWNRQPPSKKKSSKILSKGSSKKLVVHQKGSKNLKEKSSKKNVQENCDVPSASSHSSSEDNSDDEENEELRSEMVSHLEKKLHHHHHHPDPQKDKHLKSKKSHAHSNDEDEARHRHHHQETLACRQSHSKRPSTPQRPITVPRKNHSSTDDLSFNKIKSGGKSAPPPVITDNYYYSQSDDQDRRKPRRRIASPPPPEVPLTPKKCVTFYKDKPSSSPSPYQSRYKYNPNYANYSSGDHHQTAITNYFPGKGGGLAGTQVKKYC